MTLALVRRLFSMTQNETHIGQVATIMVPVTDQDAALAFYTETLGMQKVNDLTYPTGERWLEVSPAKGSANLCLVGASRTVAHSCRGGHRLTGRAGVAQLPTAVRTESGRATVPARRNDSAHRRSRRDGVCHG